MIAGGRPVALRVRGDGGEASCRTAESLGLIVTEFVINPLKHAFSDIQRTGEISVAYDVAGTDWKCPL